MKGQVFVSSEALLDAIDPVGEQASHVVIDLRGKHLGCHRGSGD